MSYPATDRLSSAERAFLINAGEVDILPGVRGDLDEPLVSRPASALVPILLSLVDRGWIEVCRVVPLDSGEQHSRRAAWSPCPEAGAPRRPGGHRELGVPANQHTLRSLLDLT